MVGNMLEIVHHGDYKVERTIAASKKTQEDTPDVEALRVHVEMCKTAGEYKVAGLQAHAEARFGKALEDWTCPSGVGFRLPEWTKGLIEAIYCDDRHRRLLNGIGLKLIRRMIEFNAFHEASFVQDIITPLMMAYSALSFDVTTQLARRSSVRKGWPGRVGYGFVYDERMRCDACDCVFWGGMLFGDKEDYKCPKCEHSAPRRAFVFVPEGSERRA